MQISEDIAINPNLTGKKLTVVPKSGINTFPPQISVINNKTK